MARPFSPATAEQVIATIDAVAAFGAGAKTEFVAAFADITSDQAESALALAVDLGFLTTGGDSFAVESHLCRFVAVGTDPQRAVVLRAVLEGYKPFAVFRDRLLSTDPVSAAKQTKAILELDAHHEDVRATLISLGTYTQALVAEAGGQYLPATGAMPHTMEGLAAAAEDMAAAEGRIRQQLGPDASHAVSTDHVIGPLADALLRSGRSDGRGAVVTAGNALESYLVELAQRYGVNIGGATGINSKIARFASSQIPRKIASIGRYLGDLRNAADHGIDTDVGAPWTIRPATGVEYVYVTCSFISNCTTIERAEPPEL